MEVSVNFTPAWLFLQGKGFWYTLAEWAPDPQCGCFGEQKSILLVINLQFCHQVFKKKL